MNLTKQDMRSIINAIGGHYEISTGRDKHDFMCGKCDALALGLQDALTKFGITSSLTRISRTTTNFMEFDEEDECQENEPEIDYVDTNDFCHVYLDCLGEEWDIGTNNASERYENDWYDESYQQTDFSYVETTERELLAIRVAKAECLDEETRMLVATLAEVELSNIAAMFTGAGNATGDLLTP